MTNSATATDAIQVLSKQDTVNRLYHLIDDAREWVLLCSPYVTMDKLRDLERHIRSALGRKVAVSLIVRAADNSTHHHHARDQEVIQRLMSEGLRLEEAQDLHAKIYLSERCALLTSLNLLESSFNNSIEIGTWIPASRAEYQQVLGFIRGEVKPAYEVHRSGGPVDAPIRRTSSKGARGSTARAEGYCIRCEATIRLDPSHPYCRPCYGKWAEYENPDYEDVVCHACGDDYSATMNKPLCRACFRSVGSEI